MPDEPRRLAIALGGPRDELSWAGDKTPMDFYDLKGAIEAVLRSLGISNASFEPTAIPGFHPGRTARLTVGGQDAGVLGEVHPDVREKFDLPQIAAYVAELDLNILTEQAVPAKEMTPISRFPAVSQDVAVVVDDDVPAQEVRATIVEAGGNLLVNAVLFDVYRSEQIGAGKKSLAYALTFQAPDRTLTDAEVNLVQEAIVQQLQARFAAILRS